MNESKSNWKYCPNCGGKFEQSKCRRCSLRSDQPMIRIRAVVKQWRNIETITDVTEELQDFQDDPIGMHLNEDIQYKIFEN